MLAFPVEDVAIFTGIVQNVLTNNSFTCVVIPGMPVMRDRVPGDMNQW
jgi:hypothetical protein